MSLFFVEEYEITFLTTKVCQRCSEDVGEILGSLVPQIDVLKKQSALFAVTVVLLSLLLIVISASQGQAHQDDEFPTYWESVLWQGLIHKYSKSSSSESGYKKRGDVREPQMLVAAGAETSSGPGSFAAATTPSVLKSSIWEILGLDPAASSTSNEPNTNSPGEIIISDPQSLKLIKDLPALDNIPPLYATPPLANEGVWESTGLPTDNNGNPLMYKTSYRPSELYPNAIVHMLLFDMKRVSMRLYLGSSEPAATASSSIIQPEDRYNLVAITNALWKQKHSGQAGTIFASQVVKTLFPGMATLVIYQDSSVDIIEWSPDIPVEYVSDAKQLRHLIVKDGKVVSSIPVNGRPSDSEIGLGYLLSETDPMAGYQSWGGWWGQPSYNITSGPDWFIATRSAFGIRNDGNLVFAVGHHISTKDLAKALVLSGCVRAIHGDANPHNVVGNIYFPDGNGKFTRKEKLSPDQKTYTLDRYVDRSYTSDFFAFFRRND